MWPFTKKQISDCPLIPQGRYRFASPRKFPKTQPSDNPLFNIGPFGVDLPVIAGGKIIEASDDEYVILGRNFVGETIFHAPPVLFLDLEWTMMLATVNGQVYKVDATYTAPDRYTANDIASRVLNHCNQHFGPSENQQSQFFFWLYWNACNGNAILQTAGEVPLVGFQIDLFLTSRKVRSFQLAR